MKYLLFLMLASCQTKTHYIQEVQIIHEKLTFSVICKAGQYDWASEIDSTVNFMKRAPCDSVEIKKIQKFYDHEDPK